MMRKTSKVVTTFNAAKPNTDVVSEHLNQMACVMIHQCLRLFFLLLLFIPTIREKVRKPGSGSSLAKPWASEVNQNFKES